MSERFSKRPPRYGKRAATSERRAAEIVAYFDSRTDRVFSLSDLRDIFSRHNLVDFHLPVSWKTNDFVKAFIDTSFGRHVELRPEGKYEDGRAIGRYIWRQASSMAVALSLRPRSFLSHSSAMFIHALTEQAPKTIYANKEQSPKPSGRPESMTQGSIDRAFQGKARFSNYIFSLDEARITLLNGKSTGDFEVGSTSHHGELLRVTRLERTLVDAVVRPAYAGGVPEVLEAFRRARQNISMSTILAVIRQLGHMYPYHQSVGFYMDRAGYESSALSRLHALERRFDFYLDNRMDQPHYDSNWRIYYPQGLH